MRSDLDGNGLRIAILVSRWHEEITGQLLMSAVSGLTAHGVSEDDIDIHHVPGAFELPVAASWVLDGGRHDCVIALGCVIRGETDHNVYINQAVAEGLTALALESRTPLILGVLTTFDVTQAERRADPAYGGGKGHDCALAAIEMVRLRRSIETSRNVRG